MMESNWVVLADGFQPQTISVWANTFEGGRQAAVRGWQWENGIVVSGPDGVRRKEASSIIPSMVEIMSGNGWHLSEEFGQ